MQAPNDAQARRDLAPVMCYPTSSLQAADLVLYRAARVGAKKVSETLVAPRDARTFRVSAGNFFRISCVEGSQVGDLNLWCASQLQERFYSGKTRALHGTHVKVGDSLWSNFPYLRPMATIVHDTLEWYGVDRFGGRVHDVIGTRCDPYSNKLLMGTEYHRCCHSNLSRALGRETRMEVTEAEKYVHDVLNVFMCTGFSRDSGRYFMKGSPARKGDFIEFFAEIDLLGALSTCPGGDCSARHSSDEAGCFPLKIEVFAPPEGALQEWISPTVSTYSRNHGAR